MKKRNLGRIALLTLVLCMITVCLLSGTLAKYVTTVTGDATATVEAWSFKANGQAATMTAVNLKDTVNTDAGKLRADHIAPGTSGSFAIEIDPTGSEVGVKYTIAFTDIAEGEMPTNLKFYSDAGKSQSFDFATGFSDTIALPSGGIMTATEKVTETVYWDWPYETGDTPETKAANNATDTGDANKDIAFTITVTGEQVEPATP